MPPNIITWTEELKCNAGHGIRTSSPQRHWKETLARCRHFLLLGINTHIYRDYATHHPRIHKFYSTEVTNMLVQSTKHGSHGDSSVAALTVVIVEPFGRDGPVAGPGVSDNVNVFHIE